MEGRHTSSWMRSGCWRTCWMRWKRKTSAMDNHDVVALYVAEMHALLPVVQRHLETLGRADAEAQYGLAARAATRVATALADLSTGFHVEDCAQMARAIAQTFSTADGDETPVESPRPEEPPAASYMPDTTGATGEPEAAAELGAPVASRMPTASELDTIPPEMQRLFVVETSEDLHDLRTLLLQYEEQQDNHGSLLAMGRISHKIKGAAGTLGFDGLASLAFTFEDLLTALQTLQVAPGPHAVSILVRGLALIQAALDAASSDHAPDPRLIARAQDLRD